MATDPPRLFVSYASSDRERVLPIVDRLAAAEVKTWVDRVGIHGGANYAQVINDAIKGSAGILLFASPASLASRNVKQEIALGWRYQKPYLPLVLNPVEIPDELVLRSSKVVDKTTTELPKGARESSPEPGLCPLVELFGS